MRLSNFRRLARFWDHLFGGDPPRSRPLRLGVEGLGDRTVPSAVGSEPTVVTVERIADAAEGGAEGLFRFARTGDTTDPLTVDVSYGGTAAAWGDYRLDPPFDRLTFPAGASSVDVAVEAPDDGEYDPGETVAVTVLPPGLAAAGLYEVGAEHEAAVAIADAPPAVEPTGPREDTMPMTPPSESYGDGPPAESTGSIDGPVRGDPGDPGDAGARMSLEAAVPAADTAGSDPPPALADGDDVS